MVVSRFGQADLAEFRARLSELRDSLAVPALEGAYVAHTDGACFGNPQGPGGWAAVVDAPATAGAIRWELWGHLSSTSNNRAEALGVLAALEWIPAGSALDLRSDSELTVMVLAGRYKARANLDIWQEIRERIAAKQLSVAPMWVAGHMGDPGNELADQLSKLGARNGQPPAGPVPPPSSVETAVHSELAALAGLEPHGDWEKAFLVSVTRQLRNGRPLSAKQQAVIDRIRSRG